MLDLLDGLDGLVNGESDLDGDTATEGEQKSDSVEAADRTDDEYSEDEEWAGVSKGGQEHEGGSKHSDSTVPKPVPLVVSSPAKGLSRSRTIRPVLLSNTPHRCWEICPTSPSTTKN